MAIVPVTTARVRVFVAVLEEKKVPCVRVLVVALGEGIGDFYWW